MFDIPDVDSNAQVVHSLAKWKRLALKRYQFKPGKGLFTDMNAIRRDEEVDNTHSIYVDQWDWEKVIEKDERNEYYLRQTVRSIVSAICETNDALQIAFPSLHTVLDREVFLSPHRNWKIAGRISRPSSVKTPSARNTIQSFSCRLAAI